MLSLDFLDDVRRMNKRQVRLAAHCFPGLPSSLWRCLCGILRTCGPLCEGLSGSDTLVIPSLCAESEARGRFVSIFSSWLIQSLLGVEREAGTRSIPPSEAEDQMETEGRFLSGSWGCILF